MAHDIEKVSGSRLPADGRPYAYARVAFGNQLGFANCWSYWITGWAGTAAIARGGAPRSCWCC